MTPRRYHPGVPLIQAQVILGSAGLLAEPDEQLLCDVLASCGASTQVEPVPVHRGESAALTWIVLAVLPLQAFLAALGSKLADDGYAQVRALVKRLAGRRQQVDSQPGDRRPAPLVLMDRGTGLQIVLEADLPAAAYRQLTTLDLSQYRIGPLHYDLARGRWRAELDEAAAPDAALPDVAPPDPAPPDPAPPDAALPDAALPDAALPDAALPDAAPPDAAPPDPAPPNPAPPRP